jgi:putative selenium metabolism protein SsnA
MHPSLLLRNGRIVMPSSPPRVLEGQSVLIENGIITRIAPQESLSGDGVAVLDAGGMLVLPGFINAHTHLYSTFACGLYRVRPSSSFLEVLENLWWRLDKTLTLEDCFYSALPALIASIRCGTTTLIDHHASPFAIRGSLDTISRAVKMSGLRACLCYEVSDRDGEERANEGIEENREFLTHIAASPDEHVRGLFGLHASFTLSDRTIERASSVAHQLGTGVHIHVAESDADQRASLTQSGMRVVERLYRSGLLNDNTIAAHCVHLNDAERDVLAECGTMVVHNPQSNMNNAVGIADISALLRREILVGIGTDAMTTDMREEMRVGIWAQRHDRGNPSAGFAALTSALWSGNPAIASRLWQRDVGQLREGAAADIIILDYVSPTPLTSDSLSGHLVFGMARARVDTTIVGGRVLMQNGRLMLDLDEQEVAARARECAARVWSRFG